MGIFKGNFRSEALQMMTSVSIALPNKQDDEPMKVIYLLHGLSDNADAWADNVMLSVFADEYNVCFVCPEVQRSFYQDMDFGLNYFTYIADELPEIMRRTFNVSTLREDNAVMGLSMGGFGALKLALMRPERFHLCGAFSSAISPLRRMIGEMADLEQIDDDQKEWVGVFGRRSTPKRGEDLQALVKELIEDKPKEERPLIHMTCGKQDFLYDDNLAFKAFMEEQDIDFCYNEKDGVHDWYFWNDSLKMMLDLYYKKQ